MHTTNHWKFQTGDRVEVNLGPDLGYWTGTILGISVDHIVQIFIVGLDKPCGPYRAVTLPSSEIKKLDTVSDRDIWTTIPEELSIGQLNGVVRALREEVHQLKLKLQQSRPILPAMYRRSKPWAPAK